MESTFPLLFAAVLGFTHAFEADHLVAVSSIVTKRDRVTLAVKDGIFWGLGHSSTILLIGGLMILGSATFLNGYFSYFEAIVGAMLIILGIFRIYQLLVPTTDNTAIYSSSHHHHLAYGVGLVHGLAGSGAMVLLVMSQSGQSAYSLLYLLIFGLGSVIGMLTAAGVLGLPLAQKALHHAGLRVGLILLSALLCIGYGSYVLIEQLS